MKNPIYQFPTIEFIGGETSTFIWNLWSLTPNEKPNQQEPFNASGCTVTFSLINFSDRFLDFAPPILSKKCELRENTDGLLCIAVTNLASLDTVDLEGKFIYQLTINSPSGEAEVPGQGIFYINGNIDRALVKGSATSSNIMRKFQRSLYIGSK